VIPSRLVDICQPFRGTYYVHMQSTTKVEAVDAYQTTRHNVPADNMPYFSVLILEAYKIRYLLQKALAYDVNVQ